MKRFFELHIDLHHHFKKGQLFELDEKGIHTWYVPVPEGNPICDGKWLAEQIIVATYLKEKPAPPKGECG